MSRSLGRTGSVVIGEGEREIGGSLLGQGQKSLSPRMQCITPPPSLVRYGSPQRTIFGCCRPMRERERKGKRDKGTLWAHARRRMKTYLRQGSLLFLLRPLSALCKKQGTFLEQRRCRNLFFLLSAAPSLSKRRAVLLTSPKRRSLQQMNILISTMSSLFPLRPPRTPSCSCVSAVLSDMASADGPTTILPPFALPMTPTRKFRSRLHSEHEVRRRKRFLATFLTASGAAAVWAARTLAAPPARPPAEASQPTADILDSPLAVSDRGHA